MKNKEGEYPSARSAEKLIVSLVTLVSSSNSIVDKLSVVNGRGYNDEER